MEQFLSFFAQNSRYVWGAILIVGIPALTLVLSEAIDRLQRQAHPEAHPEGTHPRARFGARLAAELSHFRNLVLPLLSLRLLMQYIFGLSSSLLSVRIVETLLWLVVIYRVLNLLAVLVGAGAPRAQTSSDSRTWELRLPRVWSELLRLLTVVGGGFYVLGALWGVPMDQVFAVLGVGSIVVGFALQDTLSSLVAGMLLAFEKPFEIGHWVRYDRYEGKVLEMNWRAVRLITRERDVIIIPNAVMGKDVVTNYTLLDPLHAEHIQVSFAYHHPPNQIRRMLLETALATPGVVHDPAPHIRITGYAYDKFAINYEIKLYLLDFYQTEFIRDEVLTRIYYAAQRYHFSVPYQTTIFYQRDGAELTQADAFPDLLRLLPTIPYFANLSPTAHEQLARGAALHQYGAEERLIQQGARFPGFYVILEGQVQLTVLGADQQRHEVATLGVGDFFGEIVLLREQPSPYTVTVTQDMKALFIARLTFIEVVETNPRLAMEMNRFIEERAKLVRRATGVTENGTQRMSTHTNGWSH